MTRRVSSRGGYLGLASVRSWFSPCLLSNLLLSTCPILDLSIMRDRHLPLPFHPLNPTLYPYTPYSPFPPSLHLLHHHHYLTSTPLPLIAYNRERLHKAIFPICFTFCSALCSPFRASSSFFFSFRFVRDISSACIIFCFQPHWHSVSMTWHGMQHARLHREAFCTYIHRLPFRRSILISTRQGGKGLKLFLSLPGNQYHLQLSISTMICYGLLLLP